MFDWLYTALGWLLSFFNSITGSYALALLLYALVFKIVLIPFGIKQQKNQVKGARLTPKIELIKAKYKGRTDHVTQQRMQQEIMDLQQKEGASPMSGCLPMILQLVIVVLLYTVIQNPLSYMSNTNSVIDDYNQTIATEGVTEETLREKLGDTFVDKYEDIIFTVKDGETVLSKTKIDKNTVILHLYREFSPDDGAPEAKVLPNTARWQFNLLSAITHELYPDGRGKSPLNEEAAALLHSLGMDAEQIPDFEFFGINLADTPDLGKIFSEEDAQNKGSTGINALLLCLIPLLAAAFSWLSMFLTRKLNKTGIQGAQDDQTQKSMVIMDLVMPAMTLFIAFGMPGMLGVYWIYQSVFGFAQTFILSRVIPLPTYTEEELHEMRRAQREAEKAAREAAKSQPRHRSLHYIDEDDYDELPEAPGSQDGAPTRPAGGDIPEIKD